MDSDPSSSRHGAAAAVVFVPQHIAEPSTSAMTLQPPGEPAGVFFSLSSSQPESIHPSSSSLPSSRPSPASGAGAATASREPRRIAKAPSSRSRPRLRHPHLSNADDFSSSSKARAPPLYTVDNSLKVDLSVCARPPQPADAPPVTLAVYCDPHPSTVDLTPFAVAAAEVERREKSKETKSRTGGPAAKGRTNGTSTTSTTGRTTPTPASSRYTPAASVSTSSTHPSSPGLLSEPPDLSTSVSSLSISTPASPATTPLVAASTTPKRPAWATPKSWAELAARGSSGLPATASSLHSGVSCAGGDVSLPSDSTPTSPSAVTSPRPQANGARSGILPPAKKPAPVGLDALLADAHTRFNAPLTHPRGLVNNGNFCFANAVSADAALALLASMPRSFMAPGADMSLARCDLLTCRSCKFWSIALHSTISSPLSPARCRMTLGTTRL